jgi:hypothetical protein
MKLKVRITTPLLTYLITFLVNTALSQLKINLFLKMIHSV